jgi:hypothetical protein
MFLDAVQMLDAEGAGACQGDFDNFVHLSVLQNQIAKRRVGRRYMIKTVFYAYWTCARSYVFNSIRHFVVARRRLDIGHRAARNRPHHQLNAFAPSLAHVVDVRRIGQALRVGDQPVEEGVVERLVDQAGARPCS